MLDVDHLGLFVVPGIYVPLWPIYSHILDFDFGDVISVQHIHEDMLAFGTSKGVVLIQPEPGMCERRLNRAMYESLYNQRRIRREYLNRQHPNLPFVSEQPLFRYEDENHRPVVHLDMKKNKASGLYTVYICFQDTVKVIRLRS